jgi:hypothetical protein
MGDGCIAPDGGHCALVEVSERRPRLVAAEVPADNFGHVTAGLDRRCCHHGQFFTVLLGACGVT